MNDRRYKVIVFDWDGTLMDSASKIVNCFRSAALDTGLPVPSPDAVRQIIGLGLAEALASLFPGAREPDLHRVADTYREYFLERDDTATGLFPGVIEGLSMLKSESFVLAVATGKARRGLDRIMKETDVDGLFSATRCVDEARSKPHPQMLRDILAQTRFESREALMVGDTTFDMQMAAATGMDALAVSYGAHALEPLLAERPRACVDDFSEVVRWIREN